MCLPSGSWSGIQPSCSRVCPHPPRLKHGFSTGQQFWEGKRVLFICKPGYRLSGPSEIFCTEHGTWTGTQPRCKGKKGSLPTVPGLSCRDIHDNGDLDFSGFYWIRPAGSLASFQGYCDKTAIRQWTRVTLQWVKQTYEGGVTLSFTEENGGLVISGQVTRWGCGSGKSPGALTLIKGYWTKIKYTQEFRGKASCWSIFGDNRYGRTSIENKSTGVHSFDPSQGDYITNQYFMGGKSHIFDGQTTKCNNLNTNFWRYDNSDVRYATVTIRRELNAENAGIFTGTSCGTPTYKIKDIYVYF
ncbi:uncharacterized protein LOC111329459 [Stylophora pistillata]|uniref:uncharacterized protein LOC111329459 n=1 Tax=Stylophora pistillata TaxID=50429 RepID=UPI000C04FF42|nr:uncharacterized protein LOC111329459 [Stylophora pistillata]